MNIKKKITYIDVDDDQEYTLEPIEGTQTLEPNDTDEKFKGEFLLKYLTQDNYPMSPDEFTDDDSLFLVHYHRSFWVESKVVEEDDLVDLFRGEKLEDGHYLHDYHVFFTSAYIHSGVNLRLGESAFAGQLRKKSGQMKAGHVKPHKASSMNGIATYVAMYTAA